MEDGTPFFTDGLRAVMMFGTTKTPLDQIRLLDWEKPLAALRRPRRSAVTKWRTSPSQIRESWEIGWIDERQGP